MTMWCVQTLFVQRLHEVEATGDLPGSSTQGLPQKELLSWYFDKMVERCALPALPIHNAWHTQIQLLRALRRNVKRISLQKHAPYSTSASQHSACLIEAPIYAVLLCSHQYQTTEELSQDYRLVCKIVHHLIKRDNVLIVLGTPDRNEDESNEAFAKRQQQERVLAVNPNYSVD